MWMSKKVVGCGWKVTDRRMGKEIAIWRGKEECGGSGWRVAIEDEVEEKIHGR